MKILKCVYIRETNINAQECEKIATFLRDDSEPAFIVKEHVDSFNDIVSEETINKLNELFETINVILIA